MMPETSNAPANVGTPRRLPEPLASRPCPPDLGQSITVAGHEVVARKKEKGLRYYVYDLAQLDDGGRPMLVSMASEQLWDKLCHYLGWYPEQAELKRRPQSWPGPLPTGFSCDEAPSGPRSDEHLATRDESCQAAEPGPDERPSTSDQAVAEAAQTSLFGAESRP